MSYFINPDGTITFVEDRYDSAGNLTPYKPQTHNEITGDDRYDNREMYSNVSRKVAKRKAKHKAQVKKYPQNIFNSVDFENFTIEVLLLRSKNDIRVFFEKLINESKEFTEVDYLHLKQLVPNDKRYYQSLEYHYSKYKEDVEWLNELENGRQET